MADPIDMTTFKDAIQKWFADSLGSGATVIWEQQSAPRPDYPYGSLRIIAGPIPASNTWEQRTLTDTGRPQGQEVEFSVSVPCTFTVSCQARELVKESRGNDARSAMTLVSRAQTRLYLPTVRDEFKASGVSVQSAGPVQNLTAIFNDANVDRAGMDVVFGAVLEQSEFTGYIKTVEVSSTSLGFTDVIIGDLS